MLVVTGNLPKEFEGDSYAFARWIIAEHPYSQAALEARIVLNSGIDYSVDNLKEALKYHPVSPALHAEIASGRWGDYPEESVAFAKKALRLLSATSEDYLYRGVYDSPEVRSHRALGLAYQHLGDYKSALVHLKAAQRLYKSGITGEPWDLNLDAYNNCVKDIEAIEAGKPRWGQDPKLEPAFGGISVKSSATPIVSISDADELPAASDPRAFYVPPRNAADTRFEAPSFPFDRSSSCGACPCCFYTATGSKCPGIQGVHAGDGTDKGG